MYSHSQPTEKKKEHQVRKALDKIAKGREASQLNPCWRMKERGT